MRHLRWNGNLNEADTELIVSKYLRKIGLNELLFEKLLILEQFQSYLK